MTILPIDAIWVNTSQDDRRDIRRRKTSNKNPILIVKTQDGKYIAVQQSQLIKYLLEFQKKHQTKPTKTTDPTKQDPYELGPRKNDTRIITVDNVTDPLKPGSTAPSGFETNPNRYEEAKNNLENPNDKIDNFRQGRRGDCYFLTGLHSLSTTEDGQKILAENIKENKDGSITVKLPGAIAVRNDYEKMGYKEGCAITGEYTITKEALEKAKQLSGKSYAFGDIEVIAYELAMEAYRAEIAETNKTLDIKDDRFTAGRIGPSSDIDTLSSGVAYDAIFLLTGQKSDLYEVPSEKRAQLKPYVQGEYGFVGEWKSRNLKGGGTYLKSFVEIENYYDKESDLQRMLDQYKDKEEDYAITVGVIVGQKAPDGTTKIGGGHALTVTKITDEYVEVVNPWDTKKRERIPRGEFEKMANRLTVTPISKEKYNEFCYENNVKEPPKNIIDFIVELFA